MPAKRDNFHVVAHYPQAESSVLGAFIVQAMRFGDDGGLRPVVYPGTNAAAFAFDPNLRLRAPDLRPAETFLQGVGTRAFMGRTGGHA